MGLDNRQSIVIIIVKFNFTYGENRQGHDIFTVVVVGRFCAMNIQKSRLTTQAFLYTSFPKQNRAWKDLPNCPWNRPHILHNISHQRIRNAGLGGLSFWISREGKKSCYAFGCQTHVKFTPKSWNNNFLRFLHQIVIGKLGLGLPYHFWFSTSLFMSWI